MNEIRCIHCQNLNRHTNNFCEHCGRPLHEHIIIDVDNIDDKKVVKRKYGAGRTLWLITRILIIIFCLILLIDSSDNNTRIGTMFIIIIPIISILEEFIFLRKRIAENKKITFTLSRVLTVLAIIFTIIGLAYQDADDSNTLSNEPSDDGYVYEIEPGYEYLEPIALDEMQNRIQYKLSAWITNFEYLLLEEVNGQFFVSFDITNVNNVDGVIQSFKEIVEIFRNENTIYPYIKDLSVHYYYEGEYLYTARLYNLFLKGVIDVEKDSSIYDSRSDSSALIWTIRYKPYEFPKTRISVDIISETEQKYLDDYEEWYGDFDEIMNDLYDDFILLSDNFIDNGIEPSMQEIREFDYLTRRLQTKCDSFDELIPDVTYEVFHQYFSRGCRFYHKAYTIGLDGFNHNSIDRVEYAYIDLDLGYYYFDQIFGEEEEIEGIDV